MKLKLSVRGGICDKTYLLLEELKKSCRKGSVLKPWAQVKNPPAWRPCEKRLVALVCKESYLEPPVGEPEGPIVPYCGKGLPRTVDSALLVGKPQGAAQL